VLIICKFLSVTSVSSLQSLFDRFAGYAPLGVCILVSLRPLSELDICSSPDTIFTRDPMAALGWCGVGFWRVVYWVGGSWSLGGVKGDTELY
jgi:hypothetical protein